MARLEQPPGRRRWPIILLVLLAILGCAPVGHYLSSVEGVPYNVREVLTKAPLFVMPILAAGLVAFGAGISLLARWSARHPLSYAAAVIPIHVVVSGLVFRGLREIVPDEAIWDILGYPTLDIGYRNELALRFMGFTAAPVGLLALGARLPLRMFNWKDIAAVAANLVLAAAGFLIVIRFANTDNIVELLRDGGGWIAVATIGCWLVVEGLVVGRLGDLLNRAANLDFVSLGIALLMMVVVIPLGWQALVWAGEEQINKYDLVFSTRQFLLSPSREQLLSDWLLFPRYAAAHAFGLCLIALGAAIPFALARTNKDPRVLRSRVVTEQATSDGLGSDVASGRPSGDRTGSIGGELTPIFATGAGLAAFVIIAGSLAPFRFSPMGFREALDEFIRVLGENPLGDADWTDWAVNFMVAIPLSFFGLGLFCEKFGRAWHRVAVGSVVTMLAAISISVISEFGQVWLGGRFTSSHDIANQALGAAVGVLLWVSLGPWFRRWLKQLPVTETTHDRRMWILHGYVIALFIEMVFPVDAMTEKVEIWAKYENHGFELIPFSRGFDSIWEGIAILVLGIAKFIPIGIYTTIVNRGERARSFAESMFWGTMVVLAMECCQFLMLTRLFSATDILLGVLGVGIGVFVCHRFIVTKSVERERAVESDMTPIQAAAPWLLAAVAYSFVVMFAYWLPYSLIDDRDVIMDRIDQFASMPFRDWEKATLGRTIVESIPLILWGLPLGALLGVACFRPRFSGESAMAMVGMSLAVIALVPTLVEAGQVVVVGKFVSPTDVVIMSGAGLGGWFFALLVFKSPLEIRIGLKTSDEESSAAATTIVGNRNWIPGLDGLRAIACLAVFGVHFQQLTMVDGSLGPFDLKRALLNGNTGVAIFFLLSGFLLSLPIWQSTGANPAKDALKGFAVRRVMRMLPAYFLCLFGLYLLLPDKPSLPDLLLHFTFLHSLTDKTFYSINEPFWTQSIQMLFYAIFGALLLVLVFARVASKKVILSIFVTGIIATYVAHVGILNYAESMEANGRLPGFISADGPAVTRSIFAHLPIFLMGTVVSFLFTRWASRKANFYWDALFWGCAVMVALILMTPFDDLLQVRGGRYNLPYVPLLLSAMILSVPSTKTAVWLLELAPLRLLGVISYGFYIFHLPCMKAVNLVLSELDATGATKQGLLVVVGGALAVVVSSLSFVLVEKPLNRAARHWSQPKRD